MAKKAPEPKKITKVISPDYIDQCGVTEVARLVEDLTRKLDEVKAKGYGGLWLDPRYYDDEIVVYDLVAWRDETKEEMAARLDKDKRAQQRLLEKRKKQEAKEKEQKLKQLTKLVKELSPDEVQTALKAVEGA